MGETARLTAGPLEVPCRECGADREIHERDRSGFARKRHPYEADESSLQFVALALERDRDRLREQRDELLKALRALLTNEHVNLGDLVYVVRDREGLGRDGPSVKAWSAAVGIAESLITNSAAARDAEAGT